MKIIIATPLYPPEIAPSAAYIKQTALKLSDKHEVVIVAYASTAEKVPKTTLITVSKRRPLPVRLVEYVFSLFRASSGADVIYAQNAVAAGLPAIIVGYLRNIPVVLNFAIDEAWERATQMHLTTKSFEEFIKSKEGNLKIRLIKSLERIVLRSANTITTPSQYLAEKIALEYGFPRKKIVVNYGVAPKEEILPLKTHSAKHQIVTISKLVDWQNIEGIIRAIHLLKEKFFDIKLIVAGTGPEEENLKALAEKLDIVDRVSFLGQISHAEEWYIIKNSEVFISNSSYDDLSYSILRSLRAKIPVIANKIKGIDEIVTDKETGLLVIPNDYEALADAISKIFKDPEFSKTMVKNAEKMLTKKFSWESHILKLEEVLKSTQK
jgi:glycosyltransferase involved in cell wall biosynthesis